MTDFFFYMNLSALCCGTASLIFGLVQMLRTRQGTYYKVAMLGMATMTLGLLFRFVYALCGGRTTGFSVGFLSMIGAFLFLLTSNRSYISVLEDAPTKYRRRATRWALLLPLTVGAEFCIMAWKAGLSPSLIPPLGLCLAAGFCGFFSFREVLLPDVRQGFIDCMRPYNLTVCLLALCCMTMEMLSVFSVFTGVYIGLCVVGGCALLLQGVLLYRGVRKWTT